MSQSDGNYLATWMAGADSEVSKRARKGWFEANYCHLLPSNLDASILEIGPGYGEFLSYLKSDKFYKNVKAVDNSEDVVKHCNSLFPQTVELVTDLHAYLTEKANCFDCAVMFHVLEHIPKDKVQSVLGAIRHTLTNEGVLLIEVPNMANPLIGSYKRYADFTHECGFTVESLKQVLIMAGYKNVNVRGSSVPKNSVRRFMQYSLQKICELMLMGFIYPYMPNSKIDLSTAVIGVASK
jgi:2-polyprenyl-3-methyl-5-hydroxy-6-metoxy-1,4-benzoquinol methylase